MNLTIPNFIELLPDGTTLLDRTPVHVDGWVHEDHFVRGVNIFVRKVWIVLDNGWIVGIDWSTGTMSENGPSLYDTSLFHEMALNAEVVAWHEDADGNLRFAKWGDEPYTVLARYNTDIGWLFRRLIPAMQQWPRGEQGAQPAYSKSA